MWVMVIDARDPSDIGRYAFDIVPDIIINPTARDLLEKFLKNPELDTFDNFGEDGCGDGLVDEGDEDPEECIKEIIDYFDSKFVSNDGVPDNKYFPSVHRGRDAPEKYISLVQY